MKTTYLAAIVVFPWILTKAALSQSNDVLEVVARMSENEQLYEDIEVEYRVTQEFLKLPKGVGPAQHFKTRQTAYRCVWQDTLYYAASLDVQKFYDGHVEEYRSEYGYDGEHTRINDQGLLGNIDDRRVHPYPWCPPQNLGAPDFGGTRLSDVIGFTPAYTQADPRAARISRLDSKIIGEQILGDVKCVKVASTIFLKGSDEPRGRFVWWIAPDRNYLVARYEQYTAASDGHPLNWSEVTEWKQFKPGMWMPSKSIARVYDNPSNGNAEVSSRVTYSVDRILLDPNYPISFFRDIKMPEDEFVYVLKGGQIVETLVNGEPYDTPPKTRHWGVWIVVGNIAVVVAVIAVIEVVRRKRRGSRP